MRVSDFEPRRTARASKSRLGLRVDASVRMPALPARGRQEGPTLVVSAGVHGDEYQGVRAIFEVFEELDPGDFLAVPVVNPPAFHAGMRASPVDGKNLARVFPGAPDGSVSDRIAWRVSHSVLSRADF